MKPCLFILLFLIAGTQSFAQSTYYIAANGLDANSGTSASSPWPVSKLYDGFFYLSGATILFKRGDTFVVTSPILTTSNTSSSANTLTYAAYDTGANPILTTKQSLANWNDSTKWRKTVYANVWAYKRTIAQSYPRVWLSKGDTVNKEWNRAIDSAHVDNIKRTSFGNLSTGEWIYVWAPSSPAIYYQKIESSSSVQSALSIANQHNVVVRNLDIRGGDAAAFDIGFSEHVLVDSCKIGWDAAHNGLQLERSKYIEIRNSVFDGGDRLKDSFIYQNGLQDGIGIYRGSSNVEIHDNTLQNFGHSLIGITHSTDFSEADTTTAFNNPMDSIHVRRNYLTAPDVDYCRGFEVYVNYGKDILIDSNLIENLPVENQIAADRCLTISNNIINYITHHPAYDFGIGVGLSIGANSGYRPRGMIIEHNIIANCYTAAIFMDGSLDNSDTVYYDVKENVIRDNIFYNNGTNPLNPSWYPNRSRLGSQVVLPDNWDVRHNKWIHNVMYSPLTDTVVKYGGDPGDSYFKTVNGFQAMNGHHYSQSPNYSSSNPKTTDSTGADSIRLNIQLDPLFVNGLNVTHGDFRFKCTSPIKDSGYGLQNPGTCVSTCTPPTFLHDGTVVNWATCNNNDGAIYIVPTSGSAPYQASKDSGRTYVLATDIYYTFGNLAPGVYYISIKDSSGCESAIIPITVLQQSCGGIAPRTVIAETANSQVNIFPNPNNGKFNLQIGSQGSASSSLTISDARGNVVERRNISLRGANTLQIDLSKKAKGVYFLQVVMDKEVKTFKVVVQ